MTPPLLLPRVTVQPSFFEVVDEIVEGQAGSSHAAEDVWVSVYMEEQPSVHGRVRITESETPGTVELESREGVQVERVSNTSLRVTCSGLKVPATPVHFPQTTPFTLRGGLDTLDVSPNGELVVVGGKDGQVRVVDARGNRRAIELRGHVGDVRHTAFFPSGEVVLTSSSDMGIRIFSAKDGSNPRTLVGHTKAVTSIAVLGIGRVVASASLDGTVRLWTVSDSSTLTNIKLNYPINAMAIASLPDYFSDTSTSLSPDVPPSLVAIAAHNKGTATLIPISSSPSPLSQTLHCGTSSILAVAIHPSSRLVALGSRDGVIHIFSLTTVDLTNAPLSPLQSFKRSSAAILSLQFCGDVSPTLLVGTADGLPFRASLGVGDGLGEVKVLEEFAGLDCDPAVVMERNGLVWLAAGDGKLRRYGTETS